MSMMTWTRHKLYPQDETLTGLQYPTRSDADNAAYVQLANAGPMAAFTRWMPAAPSPLVHTMIALITTFERDIAHLATAYERTTGDTTTRIERVQHEYNALPTHRRAALVAGDFALFHSLTQQQHTMPVQVAQARRDAAIARRDAVTACLARCDEGRQAMAVLIETATSSGDTGAIMFSDREKNVFDGHGGAWHRTMLQVDTEATNAQEAWQRAIDNLVAVN